MCPEYTIRPHNLSIAQQAMHAVARQVSELFAPGPAVKTPVAAIRGH